ncbi:ATP-binding protein [uncultured Cyclobacterium sp.]|mgnify:CR=1 FL=1|uniref:ATP-binding protein n=1 Tax=uncultured Cyclobacterium sp. TaxID=453820 RepID=UPI0030ED371F|tara:strand:- start:61777 stop:62310 length:534 start_codon:yes stop_codon:yes gene_type:complete
MDKIVIIGPESTGKSTLSQQLAAHYGEPWVPEYAREYIEQLDRPYTYEDLEAIARGQVILEDEKAEKAENKLFCDTDLRVIKVWSEHKFKETHDWIKQQIQTREYAMYLLAAIDIPWREDPQREHSDPAMRRYFMEVYKNEVRTSGLPWKIISGGEEHRLKTAIEFIEKSFDQKKFL